MSHSYHSGELEGERKCTLRRFRLNIPGKRGASYVTFISSLGGERKCTSMKTEIFTPAKSSWQMWANYCCQRTHWIWKGGLLGRLDDNLGPAIICNNNFVHFLDFCCYFLKDFQQSCRTGICNGRCSLNQGQAQASEATIWKKKILVSKDEIDFSFRHCHKYCSFAWSISGCSIAGKTSSSPSPPTTPGHLNMHLVCKISL